MEFWPAMSARRRMLGKHSWLDFGPVVVCGLFFFSSRRRHTRCLSDWSSDVCSSDLRLIAVTVAAIWRKDPKAIFSAWMPALSPLGLALLSPRTRNWSPVLISGKLLGLASLKRAESRE